MAKEGYLDVNVARLAHVRWEQELERLIADGAPPVGLQSHEDCDLGRWIYGRGLNRYGHEQEIWSLKTAHKRFHLAADDVVLHAGKGRGAAAESSMEQVRGLSREIVYLLTGLELSVLRQEHRRAAFHTPSNFFKGLLGIALPPFPTVLDDAPRRRFRIPGGDRRRRAFLLDANAARLNHVMWAKDLEKGFRRHGKGVALQASEECGLGVWLHGGATRELRRDEDYETLDASHKAFHRRAAETLSALRRKDYRRADDAYQKVVRLSQDIVSLLTRIEFRMEDSRSLARRIHAVL